jgi:hypothetical protein
VSQVSSSVRKAGKHDALPVSETQDKAFFDGFFPDCFLLPEYRWGKIAVSLQEVYSVNEGNRQGKVV